MSATETHAFQAEVSRVLHLVVNSLYSNKEIFLRELVSNASDAIDRLRLSALEDDNLLDDDAEFAIQIWAEPEARLLHIADNGSGMSHDQLIASLGTIAHSGTLQFLEGLKEKKADDASLIGQFGVGFYSAFLVADMVTVTSRAAGSDEAWVWTSDAQESYTLEPGERDGRGTTITLHLAEEQMEYTSFWSLRALIAKYSDYVRHPIMLGDMRPAPEEPKDEDDESEEDAEPKEPVLTLQFEQVNKGSALWQRPRDEVTDEEYVEFYKHVSNDFEDPLCWNHFKIEGTQLFTGLLYVPKRPPFDLYHREAKRGVSLFVNRVFILDDAEELVPAWLRFVKGVIDSDDLPLNVSREMLQDGAITRSIRKQVIKKTLDRLKTFAGDDAEAYNAFWTGFGPVIKEGLYLDKDQAKRIGKLLRYRSSGVDGLTSLDEYIERMPEGQEDIYYVIGESEAAVAASPHLESLKSRGWEVLYMTDPVDEWAVDGLGDYDDKKLVSATKADLDLGEEEDEDTKKEREEAKDSLEGLLGHMGTVLDSNVSEVRVSNRLTDSPVCLVVPEGGQNAYLERLLRNHDNSIPKSKRILEVNPTHPLINAIRDAHGAEPESAQVKEWVEILYDQALLLEGSPVEDPARLARRMTTLLQKAMTTT
ncbi:MAG: molecular chaperone HtpG [Deltaproteobacteria bacterium]|nr:molecular chaperone HtpG [Deltaproteobacteria bacterium]